eukprot:1500900-Alexandrium_andersonii.AAC.1
MKKPGKQRAGERGVLRARCEALPHSGPPPGPVPLQSNTKISKRWVSVQLHLSQLVQLTQQPRNDTMKS